MNVCGQISQVGFLTTINTCFCRGEKGMAEKLGTGDIYTLEIRLKIVLGAYYFSSNPPNAVICILQVKG